MASAPSCAPHPALPRPPALASPPSRPATALKASSRQNMKKAIPRDHSTKGTGTIMPAASGRAAALGQSRTELEEQQAPGSPAAGPAMAPPQPARRRHVVGWLAMPGTLGGPPYRCPCPTPPLERLALASKRSPGERSPAHPIPYNPGPTAGHSCTLYRRSGSTCRGRRERRQGWGSAGGWPPKWWKPAQRVLALQSAGLEVCCIAFPADADPRPGRESRGASQSARPAPSPATRSPGTLQHGEPGPGGGRQDAARRRQLHKDGQHCEAT